MCAYTKFICTYEYQQCRTHYGLWLEFQLKVKLGGTTFRSVNLTVKGHRGLCKGRHFISNPYIPMFMYEREYADFITTKKCSKAENNKMRRFQNIPFNSYSKTFIKFKPRRKWQFPLKFKSSEKATKIWKNLPLLFSNFVFFSQYLIYFENVQPCTLISDCLLIRDSRVHM